MPKSSTKHLYSLTKFMSIAYRKTSHLAQYSNHYDFNSFCEIVYTFVLLFYEFRKYFLVYGFEITNHLKNNNCLKQQYFLFVLRLITAWKFDRNFLNFVMNLMYCFNLILVCLFAEFLLIFESIFHKAI